MILRKAKCTVCGLEEGEITAGLGWVGWMKIEGVEIDGDIEVMLCPEHMATIADVIDKEKEKRNGVDES